MTGLQSAARIEPLNPPYQPAIAAALAKWMPPGVETEPLKLFRTLNVHDELASRMRPLGAGILGHGRLQPRDREIVILRTCARAAAEYEWGVHVVAFARPLGLTDAQIAATVRGRAEDALWSERDSLLIALSDQLHDDATIGAPLWARLAAQFSDDLLLELIITAGWYRLLSYVINAVEIEREPWGERFPAG